MQFTNPIWLWGLTTLAIPVAIHLLSRKEGKTIPIGSLRYLTESPTARFRHFKLNEILLLFLRCLLIIFLVMLLAGARFVSWKDDGKAWVLLEPGLEHDKAIQPLLDSLTNAGFEQRSLSENFPTDQPQENGSGYWTLAEQLQSENIDTAIVLTYNYQTKFTGPRTSLPAYVNWIGIEPPKFEGDVATVRQAGDSLWVRRSVSDASQTQFSTTLSVAPATEAAVPERINVRIFSSLEFNYDTKIIIASLNTLKSIIPDNINVETFSVKDWRDDFDGWTIWMSAEPYPGGNRATTISFSACNNENLDLVVESNRSKFFCHHKASDWILTKRLNEEAAIQENLTASLASIILPGKNVEHADRRVLPESMLWSEPSSERHRKQNHGRSAEPYLMGLLLLLLTTERWLSLKRNQ